MLAQGAVAENRTPNGKPAAKPVKVAPTKAKRAAPPPPIESVADELNEKWLSDHNKQQAAERDAKDAKPARPAAGPTVAAPTGAAPTSTTPPGPGPDDERMSNVPSMAAPMGPGSRAVVRDSIKVVKTASPTQALTAANSGLASYKELAKAFEGFAPSGNRVELVQGKTADGWQRTLYASIGEGKTKQTYWWFAPPDQPEGWFDDQGKRLGGSPLSEPKPDSAISSPFGTRRYYGRSTGTAFHNGIDFEGKTGEPIYAAGDGVITHQGWYYNYGRTVKISHADNFETLYAHMSRFALGVGPGNQVHRGDLIGYVGSTGRSTGPHLHFSTIVNGQFVDPSPYITQLGSGQLQAYSLVAFRQWQQEVRSAVDRKRGDRDGFVRHTYGGEWSQNPFQQGPSDR